MITTVLDVIIDGLLMGGIYALISMGLSLQYGVARVLNVAHGEFIMVGAFITWLLYTVSHISPLVVILITGPGMFVIGYILYRTLFTTLRASSPSAGIFESKSLLAAFGLLFVIQNIALIIWTANLRSYTYLNFGINIFGAIFSANRLVILGFAIIIGLIFYFFLAFTRTGKAIRAAAQDAVTAGLMGVNITNTLAICFGLGAAMAGMAGTLISMYYPVHAVMGLNYTIIAIIVVVLGGLGSIPGSFIGGFVLGVIGSVVTYLEPGLALAAYYTIFMILLLLRPAGIMGRRA